ncbi:hypothetical protein [Mangrovicoccus ximenensis]|uniref:hypothetical protein n=1 Tax=Mangrovicoccus ximenensis TaxID=1911570 RepID=UPI000D3BF20F|nr:hypothetical protein [Mangrovicoccus ximenensis]
MICKWCLRIGAVAYLAALALLAIGSFGLFGQPRDPLAGVFLMPLGLPWGLWTGAAAEGLRPWLAALAPLLNLVLLALACRWHRRRTS